MIDYSFADGLARLTLGDGDRGNTLTPESGAELFDGVRRARADGARVLVIDARGRFFSAGGDVRGFLDASGDIEATLDDLADGLHRTISEIQRLDAVVVAVVQGFAAGAGFPLAAAADIVIAAESARFTLGYTKIGFSVDGGSSLLVHSLGLHRTLRLALLNDVLTAQEAFDAGLVARVVPDDRLGEVADQLVGQLLAGSGTAQAAAKRLVRDAADSAPELALRRETLAIRRTGSAADGREGVAAFVEKRPPRFNSPAV